MVTYYREQESVLCIWAIEYPKMPYETNTADALTNQKWLLPLNWLKRTRSFALQTCSRGISSACPPLYLTSAPCEQWNSLWCNEPLLSITYATRGRAWIFISLREISHSSICIRDDLLSAEPWWISVWSVLALFTGRLLLFLFSCWAMDGT